MNVGKNIRLTIVQKNNLLSIRWKPTTWCNPMVVVPKKNGGVRICVDLSRLNKYVRKPTLPGPSPREVTEDIPVNMNYFTTYNVRCRKRLLSGTFSKRKSGLNHVYDTVWEI